MIYHILRSILLSCLLTIPAWAGTGGRIVPLDIKNSGIGYGYDETNQFPIITNAVQFLISKQGYALLSDGSLISWFGGGGGGPRKVYRSTDSRLTNTVRIALIADGGSLHGCYAVQEDGSIAQWNPWLSGVETTKFDYKGISNVLDVLYYDSDWVMESFLLSDGTIANNYIYSKDSNPIDTNNIASIDSVNANLIIRYRDGNYRAFQAGIVDTNWNNWIDTNKSDISLLSVSFISGLIPYALTHEGGMIYYKNTIFNMNDFSRTNIVALCGGNQYYSALDGDGNPLAWGMPGYPGSPQIHTTSFTNIIQLQADWALFGLQVDDISPKIWRQTRSGRALTGQWKRMQVHALGIPFMHYQWYKNDFPLASWTNNVIDIRGVKPADTGTYRAKISNSHGEIWSEPIELEVRTPLVLLATKTPEGDTAIRLGYSDGTPLALADTVRLHLEQSVDLIHWQATDATVSSENGSLDYMPESAAGTIYYRAWESSAP